MCIIGGVTSKEQEELIPSAVFEDDEMFEKHIRSSMSVLDSCIKRGEDVLIENPLSTRILLDFYCETLRRFLLWKKK